ncbi:AAA family ATPase [uncultured Polaribacter sp.]|uniref:AAA family ATPase n=1 Tax=uncultured Polaribacter sp. TaxID=174711 RepID=UPI002635D424|nr:AAA family ATPase [uncultured Polaribacter sp.]
MIKNRITRFRISKLFGYQNVDINFDNRFKIVIGENGLGKTTVLNCLYYLLDKKFKKLNTIQFSEIELHFSNKSKVIFSKNDLEFYVDRPAKFQSGGFYNSLKNELKKDDIEKLKIAIKNKKLTEQEKRFFAVETLNNINIKINAPTKFVYDNIVKFIGEKESINFQKVIDVLDKNITSKILYFPTYRRIESQLENLKKQLKSNNEYYDNPFYEGHDFESSSDEYEDIIQFGMEDVRKKIESVTDEIRHKSLVGFSKITGDLLSQLSKEFPNYKFKNSVDKNKLEIILDRVGNSISEDDKLNIIQYINSGTKTNKGLLYLIDKLIDLYNDQEVLDLAIKNFAETCNKYLNLKNFRYNESSIKLEIIRENSSDIIKLEQLSSGEKQIVSLFSKIYLDLNKSFIVLFDEPELSLSIDWQQKLLPDIIKSEKCNFLFTVTHSPFIYDNSMNEYAFGLTDYTTFK